MFSNLGGHITTEILFNRYPKRCINLICGESVSVPFFNSFAMNTNIEYFKSKPISKDDYRAVYRFWTKLEIPDNFEVHHIDFNRDNNKISNLVALPKNLHNKYHSLVNDLHGLKIDTTILSHFETGHNALSHTFTTFEQFMIIYKECKMWKDYRDHLIQGVPNFHNIKNYNQ